MQRIWQRVLSITHISVSVGWIGAVVAFLVLAVQGLRADDTASINAAYIAMAWTSCYALVPFGAAAFVTGMLESLCTPWGLLRHYWILIKLLLTIGANVALWFHMQPTLRLARAASKAMELIPSLDHAREQLIVDACAAITLLLVITALSVFKPRGTTGPRQRHTCSASVHARLQ